MKIAEIFYSIQGEGALLGAPSVFVRVSGCNLRCAWCDTPYASWHPEGAEMALPSILGDVLSYGCRHVVVTGGEPMIAPEIVPLTEELARAGLHITIETAGTVYAPVVCHLMSISPKLANSTPSEVPPQTGQGIHRGDAEIAEETQRRPELFFSAMSLRPPRLCGESKLDSFAPSFQFQDSSGHWAAQHERRRIQPEILKRLMAACDYQLKFVVAGPEDLPEIKSLLEQIGARDPARVILMPEGTDAAVLRERSLWLVEIAKREGFRFSPRLHIDLYGNRQGV